MWGNDGPWIQTVYKKLRSLNLQNFYQATKGFDFTEFIPQNEGVWIYLTYTWLMQGDSFWYGVCSVYKIRKGLLFISHAHCTDRLYLCTYGLISSRSTWSFALPLNLRHQNQLTRPPSGRTCVWGESCRSRCPLNLSQDEQMQMPSTHEECTLKQIFFRH